LTDQMINQSIIFYLSTRVCEYVGHQDDFFPISF